MSPILALSVNFPSVRKSEAIGGKADTGWSCCLL